MNRRNVLIGLGGMAAGSGVLFGTGAFASATANRTATIDVVDDADAYLGIVGDVDYTTTTLVAGAEVVSIHLSDSDLIGDGVNQEATTEFDGILELTNQSANDIDVTIESDHTALTFEADGTLTGMTPGGEAVPIDMAIDTTEGVESFEAEVTISATEASV